jgi:predicted ATPase
MKEGQRRPEIPPEFDELDHRFFSLGQEDTYYGNLTSIGPEVRDLVLRGLKDIALDLELFGRALGEDVTGVSLLRSVGKSTVTGQFHRLSLGGARLSEFRFTYSAPENERSKALELGFVVKPESTPPTNIHVLIGRNGVGKTHLLNLMSRALADDNADAAAVGKFESTAEAAGPEFFANVVSFAFSAFDPFEPFPSRENVASRLQYTYIGLKRRGGSDADGNAIGATKDYRDLADEFSLSVRQCRNGVRAQRWRTALQNLESDPIFATVEVASLASVDDDQVRRRAIEAFLPLSSGHKIVLLTITRLVESVEERTLVLLDEPEAHLHPPLLSAFIRSLSDLLTDRNGVAIVATHSPVVLQEVPRKCVWKLRRSGREIVIERPEMETFGENVGVLTGEVFGLEVTNSGFHKLLQDAASRTGYFEEASGMFQDQLGAEAKAILRSILAARHSGGEI